MPGCSLGRGGLGARLGKAAILVAGVLKFRFNLKVRFKILKLKIIIKVWELGAGCRVLGAGCSVG